MRSFTFLALAAALVTTMSCTTNNEIDSAYIGPSDIKIEDGRMSPEALLAFGRLSEPQLSPDGKFILYGVSYTSVEDNRSCRNLFICNTDGSGKVQISKDGKSISNAVWAQDGQGIYYLQGGQIWKADISALGSGQARLENCRQISEVPAGISGFSISPDFSNVMYISSVPSAVRSPKDSDPKLDKAQAFVTEDLMYRHWDNWVTELPHTFVAPLNNNPVSPEFSFDLLGGEDVKFELPLMPFGGVEQLSWSPDGSYIAYSCKKLAGKEYAFSTDTEIYLYHILSGTTTVIPMGGGYDTDPVWSPDGTKIAWLSMERNGYEADKTRLMLADVQDGKAGQIRDLTAEFKYNAAEPVWSEDGKSIYFSALAEGLQGIFQASADGGIKRLTSEELWYDFHSPFGVLEDGTLLSSYCSMDFPTELVAVKSSGEIAAITNENAHILSQLKPHKTEARYVKTVDGKDMLTWVLFPPEFDESKTYPAIEIFLGGPQGTLSQGWSYRWNYSLMAHQGYVVVLPNRRGTTAFGQEWTEQISGDYSGLNMQDYISAAKMIKAEPYIGKTAACGASYGGFSVYYMAGIHDNLFDCFIAHAGIFDEEYMYYETEEMWFPNWDNGGLREYAFQPGQTGPAGDGITFGGMQQAGSPWSNAPKAAKHYSHDPKANVTKWNTPILCIHGMMDFRIPYDQGMAAFNAAQMMGVPSKLIVFPEENHWILKPQNALFWHREYFDWLERWCK